jgi:hypothetical protein
LVKFTGISPSGLNATSDGEIRVFYDSISADQEAFWRDPIDICIKVVMLNLWGEIDSDIAWKFKPLWQMSELEQSTIRAQDSATACAYVDRGILGPEEVRVQLAVDDTGAWSGLDVENDSEIDITANDSNHWITLNGAHVLVDGDNQVISGAGGKLNNSYLPNIKNKSENIDNSVNNAKLTSSATSNGVRKMNEQEYDNVHNEGYNDGFNPIREEREKKEREEYDASLINYAPKVKQDFKFTVPGNGPAHIAGKTLTDGKLATVDGEERIIFKRQGKIEAGKQQGDVEVRVAGKPELEKAVKDYKDSQNKRDLVIAEIKNNPVKLQLYNKIAKTVDNTHWADNTGKGAAANNAMELLLNGGSIEDVENAFNHHKSSLDWM